MRVLLVSVLLAATVFAGCVGDDAPAPAASPNQAPTGNTAPAATSTPQAPSAPVTPVVQAEPPKVYKFPISGTGTTSQGVWVCDHPQGAYECTGHEVAANSRMLNIPYPDQLLSGELVVTWERVDITYALMVAAVTVTPEGGEPEIVAIGEDSNPLTVKLYDLAAAPGTIQIEVWGYAEVGHLGAYVFADAQAQDFEVAGTLDLLPLV